MSRPDPIISSTAQPAPSESPEVTEDLELGEAEEEYEEYPTMSAKELGRFFATGRRAARIAERRWPIYCRLAAAERALANRQSGQGTNHNSYDLDHRLQASFDHFDDFDGEASFVYEESWQYGDTYRYELPAKILAEEGFEERAAARMAAIEAENAALDTIEAAAEAAKLRKQARDHAVAERAQYLRLAAKYGPDNQPDDLASDPSSDLSSDLS